MEAGKEGPYISMEEVQTRSGVSKSIVDMLEQIGALRDLPKSSQMSLF